MPDTLPTMPAPTREQLVHSLYEAAELEHDLMCTYLYAAFSLKDGEAEGLSAEEAAAVARWRRAILNVAIEEMGHLTAVWNITAALGGAPRFGRGNFPLDPGLLPAGVVVKLAPFNADVLQHFIHLERPSCSEEPDGESFRVARDFKREIRGASYVTPMPVDYETVGAFYETLGEGLKALVARVGEKEAFCGDPAYQLCSAEVELRGAKPVLCLKTALQAFDAIVAEGEGASKQAENSHFNKFVAIREEFKALKAANPGFTPAHPAAHNPIMRRPVNQPEDRIWIGDPDSAAIVDVANASYQVMLRLMAYSYGIKSPSPEKALAVDVAIELMKAVTFLGESAARRPSGQAHCNAGVSFTALRDAAPLPPAASSRRFFEERLRELADGAAKLDQSDARVLRATKALATLAERAEKQFEAAAAQAVPAESRPMQAAPPPAPPVEMRDGLEVIAGEKVTLIYEGKKCIHSRWCVTGAPKVFLANVQGPWIHPDEMDAEELCGIARDCPSGAIKYRRNDGQPEEAAPLVNLARVLEGGPYAVRGDIRINGEEIGYRATLCRCGQSKNKPFCDGSHHEANFDASGEPATTEKTDMLPVRNGPLEITPLTDGPLQVRGNFEIMAGTGRMVARVTACRLCRCGHSGTKPFCDGTHAKVGFKSG